MDITAAAAEKEKISELRTGRLYAEAREISNRDENRVCIYLSPSTERSETLSIQFSRGYDQFSPRRLCWSQQTRPGPEAFPRQATPISRLINYDNGTSAR